MIPGVAADGAGWATHGALSIPSAAKAAGDGRWIGGDAMRLVDFPVEIDERAERSKDTGDDT